MLGGLPENVQDVAKGLFACEISGQAMAEINYCMVNLRGRIPISILKDQTNI